MRKAAFAAFRRDLLLGGLGPQGRQLLILLELAGGLQRNADVPHPACYACFLNSELAELSSECRKCQRLLLLFFTPRTVVLVQRSCSQARTILCLDSLLVEALHIRFGSNQSLGRRRP